MTPLEQLDYRQAWMSKNNNRTLVHSDYRWGAKRWCQANIPRHQYSHTYYTGPYEHTFFFESDEVAKEFQKLYTNGVTKNEE